MPAAFPGAPIGTMPGVAVGIVEGVWPEGGAAVDDGFAVDGTPGAAKPPGAPNGEPPGSRNIEAICIIVRNDSGFDLSEARTQTFLVKKRGEQSHINCRKFSL